MEEVPIVTANPVSTLIKDKSKEKPKKKNRIVEAIKNFAYMLPLAIIIFVQAFYLGKSFGTFTTFPYTSLTSYIFLGSLALLFLFLQMLMRSIFYSTALGLVFVAGLFSAWFGDFLTPIMDNFQSVGIIIKAAWSKKNLPFPLLMSGIIMGVFALITFLQFFLSLLVKSFFETVFGKEWGDGRLFGYLGAIALLIGIHSGFYFYSSSAEKSDNKIKWKKYSQYSPIEKFLTQTPGGIILGDKNIISIGTKKTESIDRKTGKVLASKTISNKVILSDWDMTEYPIMFTDTEIKCFNNALNIEKWATKYPTSFPELEIAPKKINSQTFIPLTAYLVSDKTRLLVKYDYGYFGVYEIETGKQLWLKSVDSKIRTNRIFPESYLGNDYWAVTGKNLFVSCYNGRVKSLNLLTGEQNWLYEHETPKFNGKGQKGYLLTKGDKVLVSFKTGELIELAAGDGRITQKTKNNEFSPISKPHWDGRKVSFVNKTGNYINLELDGGKKNFSYHLIKNKLSLIPVLADSKHEIICYRDAAYLVSPNKKEIIRLLQAKNRIFAVSPLVEKKLVYIGTQDGWVYCIHTGSHDEKWRVHINGELTSNSFKLIDSGLLVKTKSGSIYLLDKTK